jgi:hypothetical protein
VKSLPGFVIGWADSREDRDRAYNRMGKDTKEKSNLLARAKSLQALVE